jgi:hypothetical protein
MLILHMIYTHDPPMVLSVSRVPGGMPFISLNFGPPEIGPDLLQVILFTVLALGRAGSLLPLPQVFTDRMTVRGTDS